MNYQKYHLAILTHGLTDLILDGSKTIESRFTRVRCAPFKKAHEGDVVFMKESSGLVNGAFRIGKVETFENLTQPLIYDLYSKHHDAIFTAGWREGRGPMPPAKWLDSKHATLIHIAETLEFNTPFAIHKRDPRAWVVYDRISDFTKIISDENLRMSVEDILSPRSEIVEFLES